MSSQSGSRGHYVIEERIERAQWLLNNVKHASMATVNDDGSPHNTPYFFMASEDLTSLFWGSHPHSVHSKNILRDGKLFVVLYEATVGGGLYIRAQNGRIATGDELSAALARHNQLRRKFKIGTELKRSYYQPPSEQRMWIADTDVFWVNYADRLPTGHIRQDQRVEVARTELLKP